MGMEMGMGKEKVECLDQFGVAPRKTECRESFIKLTWFRGLKDHLVLADDIHIQRLGSVYHFLRRFLVILDSFRLKIGSVTGSVLISLTDFLVLLTLEEHWMICKKGILRRQFGLTQGVPHQEWDLVEAYGEVLTGPKNQDWSGTHSFWVMHWTNRYSHVLVEHLVPSQHPLDIYMHWYRGTYGAHLHLSDLVLQENQEGNPVHNQVKQQDQPLPPPSPPQPPPPPSQTQAQQELEQFTPYISDTYSTDYFTPSIPLHQ
ncbi:hypothetical protein Ahy_B07g086553 isoform A [Arachis hypogaea]|uniref:Aminotransferase-like plant mobile domain-containing protein n=1 Tax=Arachis hypogaea TaxID=3818 RepID=A0A444Y9Y7_ARAHY|nr:hypothetical protein Ahy_B07g086553 isoform A [Arachis hypogaea]